MIEVLLIENGVYHIRYYEDAKGKGVNLKLSKEEFMEFAINKIEK